MWNSENKQGWNPKIFSELFCCQRSVYYNYYPLLLLLLLGEVATAKTEDNKVTCLKWHDKRIVTMLSTFHDGELIEKTRRTRKADGGREVVKKPRMVEDYNQNMGGVDRNDQMVLYYTYSHR